MASSSGASGLTVVGAIWRSRMGAKGAIRMAMVGAIAPTSLGAIALASLGAVAPLAPTTVSPIAPTTVSPIAPTTVSPIAPTTASPIAPTTVSPIAPSHHSVLPFDGVTKTTIEGTVVRVLWQNPHTFVVVSVGDNRWTIESEGSLILQRLGWTSDSLKAGDTITVTGARAKDGRRLMRCKTISLRLRSGQEPGDRQLHCFSPSS